MELRSPIPNGLAVDHPDLLPGRSRDLVQQTGGRHQFQELGAIDERGGSHRDEEIDAAGQPLLAVFTEGSREDDEVWGWKTGARVGENWGNVLPN